MGTLFSYIISDCRTISVPSARSGNWKISSTVCCFSKDVVIHCQFRQTLSDALYDQFISELCNDQVQKTLLTMSPFTFKKAVEVTVAMETAKKDFLDISMN